MDELTLNVPFGGDTAAGGFSLGGYGDAFQPAGVNTGASSWTDVLKYGIGRIADYKIATVTPQNPAVLIGPNGRPLVAGNPAALAAAHQQVAAANAASMGGMLPLLLVAGLVLLLVKSPG